MERIAPGAFRKTIHERKDRIAVMFSHGKDPQLGLMNLGLVRDIAEDGTGVRYVFDLFDGLPQLLLEGLRAGAYGASFRAKPVKERFDPRPGRSSHNPLGLPETTITELSLREFGPTSIPAYDGTTAEIRSPTDIFEPGSARNRLAPARQLAPPEGEKPSWYLERRPSWHLDPSERRRRGRRFAKA